MSGEKRYTTLSMHQYPMLQMFLGGSYVSIRAAQHLDQRPFGSLYMRKWIEYIPGKGFHITRAGREAWIGFTDTPITRRNENGPLTSRFDAALYGLTGLGQKDRRNGK